MSQPRQCSPSESVQRALRWVGKGTYVLGAGDWRPGKVDSPYTTKSGITEASDCWGFAGAYCLKLPRHRDGFNVGGWATVSDDINTDSCIEDAEHKQELFTIADRPEPGDLLVFPSIRDGRVRKRIGHVGIIVDTSLCLEWDPKFPAYDLLEVVQCQSSSKPAIRRTSGKAWLFRDSFRGAQRRPAWSSRVVRPVP